MSRHFNILKGGVLLLLFTLSSAAQDGQSPKTMASLPPMVRELTASAMQYMDGHVAFMRYIKWGPAPINAGLANTFALLTDD